jgi:hypothetical protein
MMNHGVTAFTLFWLSQTSVNVYSVILCIIQGVSKKTLWKFNRLSCIINVAKQLNFYIRRKNSYLAFQ